MKYMFHSGTNHVHCGMRMGTRGGFMSGLLKNVLHMEGLFSIIGAFISCGGSSPLNGGAFLGSPPPPMGIRSDCPQ